MDPRRRLLCTAPALWWAGRARALPAPAAAPVLSVGGLIRKPSAGTEAVFDMAMLAGLPQHRIRTRTPWHPGTPEFTGPLLRDLLATVEAGGTVLRMSALNDYRVDIPLDDVRQYDVIVARLVDGKAIAVRDKGPLFVMYPFDVHPQLRNAVYLSRCIWQLRRIEVR